MSIINTNHNLFGPVTSVQKQQCICFLVFIELSFLCRKNELFFDNFFVYGLHFPWKTGESSSRSLAKLLSPRISTSSPLTSLTRAGVLTECGRSTACNAVGAVGSLVVRAPDSEPEGLGSMPVPQNTLRVHTEYVVVKSVGPKVLWAESRVQGTGENFPPLQFHTLIVKVDIDGGAIYRNVLSSLREFHRTKSYCHLYGVLD
ncbi:uncharacterized protein TNCV_420561 [Trichonephila clavipes]|nr:uncharacterized protein TNCV_420561 [Trichonephila clavipes]